MQNPIDFLVNYKIGLKLIFSISLKPFSMDRFMCSTEHSKLCFELLETFSAAQNNLPLQGAKNALRSRGFV